MKQRVTFEDLACIVPDLNILLNCSYLVQAYDGLIDSSKVLILKFKRKENNINKMYYLLIESGIRIHTIEEFSSIRKMPSGIIAKVRKEFKDRRLFPIEQIGTDRCLDLKFSNDKHLIIEFYDKGNFIITDNNYKIEFIVRSYKLGDDEISVNKLYPYDKIKESGLKLENDISLAKGYMIKNRTFSGFPLNEKCIKYDTINEAMQNYFSKLKIKENKVNKKKKLSVNERRNKNLLNQIEKHNKKENNLLKLIDVIQNNIIDIQEIINLIKNNKTDIKIFKKEKYFLYQNNIKIFYNLSAYENINKLYSNKKKITDKKKKALDVFQKKEKVISKKKIELNINRKIQSFEKYWWCLSDEYLILCGKSANDNEELLNNCNKKDILVHGHFDKSPWCVIKNKEEEIPLKIIINAGDFLVQRSRHWNENITNNAYYTNPEFVSKTAPSGEYIGKGSRMVHKKTFLGNSELVMGLGVIFKCGNKFMVNNIDIKNIDFGMVTCGPYNIFKNYLFRYKIKPSGSRKDKGRKKLIKAIISDFLKVKCDKILYEYIKKIPFDEWDKVCIRKFRIK